MTTLLVLLCLAFAPAPFPKSVRVPPVTYPSVYTDGSPDPALVSVAFWRDGTYEERWHGMRFRGKWVLDRDVILVECRPFVPGNASLGYQFRLRFERRGGDLYLLGYGILFKRVK